MDNTRIGQAEATTRWKAARVRLSEAIHEFSETTSIFTRALLAPTSSGKIGLDVESTIDGLDLELERLASEHNILEEAYTRLKEARNSSKRIVPINRLPLGVLYHIFDLLIAWADDCCDCIRTPCMIPGQSGHDWKTRTISLTSVCTTWRRIIIGTPWYWSHIDMCLAVSIDEWRCISTKYSKLCLQRANDTPLNLHIYSVRVDGDRLRPDLLTCPFPQCFRGQTISSISFVLNCSTDMARSIVGAWKDSTPTSTAKSLKIQSLTPYTGDLPFAHMNKKLHTLELIGVDVAWNQIKFPGLVNLSLGPTIPLPVNQLRDVLVASPALCTLVIGGRNVDGNGLAQFEGTPVELGELVFLGLTKTGVLDITLLLQMIRPAPKCMALSISVLPYNIPDIESNQETYNRMWEVTQAFCVQYKVSCLSLDVLVLGPSARTPFVHFLHSLTDVHTLALWHTYLHTFDPVVPQLGGSEPIDVFEYMTPPSLRRLYLNRIQITGAGLQRMVETSRIYWLRMDYGIIHGYSRDLSEWLKRSVPELCIQELEDGTNEYSSDFELPWWWGGV